MEELGAIDPQETPWIHALACAKCKRALERGSLGYSILFPRPRTTFVESPGPEPGEDAYRYRPPPMLGVPDKG